MLFVAGAPRFSKNVKIFLPHSSNKVRRYKMNKIFRFRFLGILMFLAMIAVFSVAAMFLWNILMPEIFGLSVLNYWQALGLVILARKIFYLKSNNCFIHKEFFPLLILYFLYLLGFLYHKTVFLYIPIYRQVLFYYQIN